MDTNKLEKVLQEIITGWGIPGLGVGIVEGEQIVYAKGFGVQSLNRETPVSGYSIFCVASITKIFVATAMMQLVEREAVALDAPVTRYLPYFKMDDKRYNQITLRQMLSHTSGMPDMEEFEYETLVRHPESDEGAAERYVRALSSKKMIANPGERFRYSNIAFNVLGDLISKVSGQSFEAYVKEHVLLPAGMPHSTLLLDEVDRQKLCPPHVRVPELIVNPVYPYHRADAPASFLHTTVEDMCHWAITCLNRGSYSGRRILSPESYELMWTPVVSRGYSRLYESAGLGWTLGHVEGVKTASHGGAGFGWTAFFVLLPEKGRGAIILCNEESAARSCLIEAVIATMLEREPVAGKVSWVVPVCQSLQSGVIQAAYQCYEEIKDSPEYSFDADDMEGLVYQLTGVEKSELAIELLKLNLRAFPEHRGSYELLASLYKQRGDQAKAEAVQKETNEATGSE